MGTIKPLDKVATLDGDRDLKKLLEGLLEFSKGDISSIVFSGRVCLKSSSDDESWV